MKKCSKCGKDFPETSEYFATRTGGKGLATQCKKCTAVHYKEYRQKNKEKIAEYWKVYRQAKKESVAKIRKRSYEANKETAAEWSREYYRENKSHRSAVAKTYRQANKDQFNIYLQMRRARKKSLPATLTQQQWESIKTYFDDKCAYCGAQVALAQDHLVAVINGGGYTAENIIPACGSCNSSKSTKRLESWYPRQSFYSEERDKKIQQHMNNGI